VEVIVYKKMEGEELDKERDISGSFTGRNEKRSARMKAK